MPRSYGVTNLAPYAAPPAVGNAGDAYYNTGTKVLYLSDGSAWNASGGAAVPAYAEIQATPPTAASPPAIVPPMGLLWVDTSIANPTTVNLPYFPPQTPPATGNNTFIDAGGETWFSQNGAAWRKARDCVRASVYRVAGASLVAPGPSVYIFDTKEDDPFVLYTPANGLFTCPVAGRYLVTSKVGATLTTANQYMRISVWRNGAALKYGPYTAIPITGSMDVSVEYVARVNANDTLAIYYEIFATMAANVAQTLTWATFDYIGA